MRRELKAGSLGLVMVGLLLVVTFASRGGHPTGEATVVERSVPRGVENTVITLLTVTYGLLLVAALILAFRYRKSWAEPKSNWIHNSLSLITLMAIIAVGYFLIARHPQNEAPETAPLGRELRIPEVTKRGKIPPRRADFNWPIAVSAVVLVLVGGALVYLRLRRPGPPQTRPTVRQELAETVETTIEDLRRERDARRAVIAAYANMERVLASHGLERRRAETPFEYLRRILTGLDVRESAVRLLTQLFEYAKFSQHEIDSAMKEEAIDALQGIRDDLQRGEALAA